jgi:hypothetical protein
VGEGGREEGKEMEEERRTEESRKGGRDKEGKERLLVDNT